MMHTIDIDVLSISDLSGNMVRDWAEFGFRCICVDPQHSIRKTKVVGNIHYTWGDVRSYVPERRPGIFFAMTPCTHLAVSGARDFAAKDWPLLRDGMDLFYSALRMARLLFCPFALENPVGRISGIHGKPDETFHPCDFGGYLDPHTDAYVKKTCLWTGGGFLMPEKRPVDPVDGQKIWKMPPSSDRQNKRSETPRGFARAVFEANVRQVLIANGYADVAKQIALHTG